MSQRLSKERKDAKTKDYMKQDLLVGSLLGSYRIKSLIGRGGMGVVYLAEHVHLGRDVALKVVAPDLAENEGFRDRFIREYRLAAAMDHPYIIPVYDAGEVDGLLFIVMRYVQGTDLKAVIKQERQLDVGRALSIAEQMASALDAAHSWGLVHRDVKPANILIAHKADLGAPDRCWLTDFGLVKHTSSASAITGTGQFVGTLNYISPEQIKGEPLDGRADLYSLGCVLFECLTGRIPFSKENDAALIYSHLAERPPSISALRPDLPAQFDAVIARAMGKDKEERYPTCTAFVQAARVELGTAGTQPGLMAPPFPQTGAGDPGSSPSAPAPTASTITPARGWVSPEWAAPAGEETIAPTGSTPAGAETMTPEAPSAQGSGERSASQWSSPAWKQDEEAPKGRAGIRALVAAVVAAAVIAAGLFLIPRVFAGPGPCPSGDAGRPGVTELRDTRIAFVSDRDGNDEIYVIDPDGKGLKRLTRNSVADRSPAWSPDGRRIAFVSGPVGAGHIFVMDCDGSEATRLNLGVVSQDSPAWSPDGESIAFVGGPGGDADVFIMNADGSGTRNLTKTPGVTESDPTWSPDGMNVAFVRRNEGNPEIFLMAASGEEEATVVPRQSGSNVQPAWRGASIVFSSNVSGNSDVYVMSPDGTGRRNLTLNVADDVSPEWAPDGTKVVFETTRDGNPEIYVMGSDGSAQVNLTNNEARDSSPSWST